MKLSKWYNCSFRSNIMCCTTPMSIRIRLLRTLMLKMVSDRIVYGSTMLEADEGADALNVSLQVNSRVVII